MRTKPAVVAIACAAAVSFGTEAQSADYLYRFDGVVTFAGNFDTVGLYANVGDLISLSLLVRDNLSTAAYTTSTATGGPDYAPGSALPIDYDVDNPGAGNESVFDPLVSGIDPSADYNGSIIKDADAKELTFNTSYSVYYPPDLYCVDHCGGTTVSNVVMISALSNGFASPDFRELGSFDLSGTSTGSISETIAGYPGPFGDYYEFALSHLTITQIGGAVPEPASWALMLGGFGLTGGAMRRRQRVSISFA